MNKQGLSLMEVIVSALILAITVGGILYIFSTEKGVVARTGRQVQAMDFGRQTLEELKNAVSVETWPLATGIGDPIVDAGNLEATTDKEDELDPGAFKGKFFGEREYTVTNIDADEDGDVDYKMVTVTVTWEEPSIEE